MDLEQHQYQSNPAPLPDQEFFAEIIDHIIFKTFQVYDNLRQYRSSLAQQRFVEAETGTPNTSDGELQNELDALYDSDDEFDGNPETRFRTKNEVKQESAASKVEETSEERFIRYKVDACSIQNLIQIGQITSILSEYLVVESRTNEVLDLDNILFTKDHVLLGNIDDVFGKVEEPKYSIYKDRYLEKRIGDGVIKVGDFVYYERNLSRVLP